MLWGHPALLALTALAGQGGTPTVGDLPFHFYVDADGDSTALPCTERFMSTTAVSALARWGVGALVAHKGEPSVRLSGLQGIAAAGAAAKAGARAGVEMKVQSKLAAPATAKPRPAAAAPAAAGDDDVDLAALDLGGDSSDDSAGDDLDALLASLGGDDDAPASGGGDVADDTPAASDEEMDLDLDALLKSLG